MWETSDGSLVLRRVPCGKIILLVGFNISGTTPETSTAIHLITLMCYRSKDIYDKRIFLLNELTNVG